MAEQTGAARVMHEEYNNTVTGWVHESIKATLDDLASCVNRYHELNPQRFEEGPDATPFVIADFGCATGASSIVPLKALIEAVRKIAPSLTIQIYLEDLPENRFDLAFQSVQKGLAEFDNLFIMAAGKDFTVQVFPTGTIDIAFSSLTCMILPQAPAPLTDNVFFLATPENVKTEFGKQWVAGFKKHWASFLGSRQKELRKHGLLFVTVIINQDPLLSYQAKESEFFGEVASQLLKDVLTKYGIAEHAHACMKTTVSVLKQHYVEVCEEIGDKVNLVSAKDYDVIDIFHEEYKQTGDKKHFGQRVASYMKGWWGDVVVGGLLQQGVDKDTANAAAKEFFDDLLPGFVGERTERYPEFYNVLALKIQRI